MKFPTVRTVAFWVVVMGVGIPVCVWTARMWAPLQSGMVILEGTTTNSHTTIFGEGHHVWAKLERVPIRRMTCYPENLVRAVALTVSTVLLLTFGISWADRWRKREAVLARLMAPRWRRIRWAVGVFLVIGWIGTWRWGIADVREHYTVRYQYQLGPEHAGDFTPFRVLSSNPLEDGNPSGVRPPWSFVRGEFSPFPFVVSLEHGRKPERGGTGWGERVTVLWLFGWQLPLWYSSEWQRCF